MALIAPTKVPLALSSRYLPNPIRLDKFPGVSRKCVEKLEEVGIKNSRHLFNAARDKSDRMLLSQKTEIPIGILNELVGLSDLSRVYGVGPVFARMIYDAREVSNLPCGHGLVKVGDTEQDVLDKCGTPRRRTRDGAAKVFIYHFGTSRIKNYVSIVKGRVYRIQSGECDGDDVDCE